MESIRLLIVETHWQYNPI